MQTDEIYKEMLSVLEDLQESASYWSEYDVPVGIVERINSVVEKAKGEIMQDDCLKRLVTAALDRVFIDHEDTCPRCGQTIDLTKPYGYDYELDAPGHRNCEAGE